MSDFAKEPAPDATDKCGELVTPELRQEIFELAKDLFWRVDGNQRLWSGEEREIYGIRAAMRIARSQAVELLAAERAENTRLQSENDAQADQISELQMTPWPEWATKVLAVIRKRSGYDGYGDAIEGVDLPAELDECIAAIEADNAALTAKLETATSLVTCCCGDPVDAHDMGSGHSPVDQYHYAMMQLEAKLAAAEAGRDRVRRIFRRNTRLRFEAEKRAEVIEAKCADAEKSAFEHGYVMACCNIVNLHDEPTIAHDTLSELGVTLAAVKAMDLSEYDLKALRKIERDRSRSPYAKASRKARAVLGGKPS